MFSFKFPPNLPRPAGSLALALIFTLSGQLLFLTKACAVGSSGFEIGSYSTSSLTKSNAVVADPQDASTIAFNPAGLTKLDANQVTTGATYISGRVEYEGSEGRDDENSSVTIIPVPYTYVSLATPIENLHMGVGSNAMFGLLSKYGSQGVFKYTGFHNEMKTKGYHLSGAYKLSEEWSIGAGWTYMEADIKQVGKYNISALVGVPGLGDGDFEFDVEGQGCGWNVGALYTPNEQHSVGIFYRSQIDAKLKGTLASDNMGALAGIFGGTNTSTSADTDIKFPDNLTIGYQYKPNEKLKMEIDLGWTGWSSFDRQDIAFGTSNAVLDSFSRVNRDFRDPISINTGMSYAIDEYWNLSGGYYFYQMSSSKSNYSADVPDGHRHGFSIGLQHMKENITVGLVYIFTFTQETEISNTVGAANGADIDGTYSTYVHVLSAGMTYRM